MKLKIKIQKLKQNTTQNTNTTEKRGMRRSTSVPKNLRSDAHAARDAMPDYALMAGSVSIRALPQSTKVMRVRFVATDHELRILFEQPTDGRVQAFELCRLDYRTLAAGCVRDHPATFVIAATDHDKLFYEIYCLPTDIPRNVWLGLFKFKHVLMTPFFTQIRSRRSSDCSGAPDDADAVRYAMHAVCEVTESDS
jgi:hypothetical protein